MRGNVGLYCDCDEQCNLNYLKHNIFKVFKFSVGGNAFCVLHRDLNKRTIYQY